MAARRVWRWPHRSRARAVAVRIPETRSRDDGVSLPPVFPCRLNYRQCRDLHPSSAGRASGPATRSRRSSACAVVCRYSASCRTRFWTCGRRSLAPSATSTVCSVSKCVPCPQPQPPSALVCSHHWVNICAQMMNEPHRGYIDLPSLHGFDYNTDLHYGDVRAYTHPCDPVNLGPHLSPDLAWAQPRPSSLSSSVRAIPPL